MVTRSFLKDHADAVEAVRAMIEEDPECPGPLEEYLRPAPEEDGGSGDGEEEVKRGEEGGPVVEYFHVMSRIHLGRYLLEKDHVKEILAEECLHYARVCRIEIVHYCIMDNHFHLFVGVRRDSLSLSKMMGCIKQQFTNKFKVWFNTDYRKEIKYRRKALSEGTLWKGRCKYERIEDAIQFGTCSLYIENNRLVVACKEAIGELSEPPSFQDACEEEASLAKSVRGVIRLMQPCYEELLEKVKGFAFQSAGYYLGVCKGYETYLTDGRDGVWASADEVKAWFRVAAKKLPEGWRKCWFKGQRGILKKPRPTERSFAANPFYQRLGQTDDVRAAQYGRLLLGSCYRKRATIAGLADDEPDGEIGASFA
jgi:REP element-mobilizing transposase RayT